jgi:hypothetical protein
MPQESMAQHHLSYTNGATPTNIAGVSDLQRSIWRPWQHIEPFTDCFLIPLKQWSEALSVAKPDQRVELLLEPLLLCLNRFLQFYLGFILPPWVQFNLFVKQVHWQILLTFYFNFLRDEEFDERIENACLRAILVRRVELVTSPECLSLDHIVVRLDHLHVFISI